MTFEQFSEPLMFCGNIGEEFMPHNGSYGVKCWREVLDYLESI